MNGTSGGAALLDAGADFRAGMAVFCFVCFGSNFGLTLAVITFLICYNLLS